MIEVIGIYTCFPYDYSSGIEYQEVGGKSIPAMGQAQALTSIPRIHCLYCRKLPTYYPMKISHPLSLVPSCNPSGTVLRQHVLHMIQNAFATIPGLAAVDIPVLSEYVYLSLLSATIRPEGATAQDMSILGYLPLNIVCYGACGKETGLILLDKLIPLLRQLLPRVITTSVSIPVLNTHACIGCANHEIVEDTEMGGMEVEIPCGGSSLAQDGIGIDPIDQYISQVIPSAIQAPCGSMLVLNELELSTDKLLPLGIQNIQNISTVINNQVHPVYYNEYTRIEIPTQLSVLTVSLVKSLFLQSSFNGYIPVHCVSANTSVTVSTPDVRVGMGQDGVSPDPISINHLRQYLMYCKSLNSTEDSKNVISMSNDVTTSAESYFVEYRKQLIEGKVRDLNDVTTHFHHCLTLVRLICCSYGEKMIQINHWQEMLRLVQWRNERMDSYHARPVGEGGSFSSPVSVTTTTAISMDDWMAKK